MIRVFNACRLFCLLLFVQVLAGFLNTASAQMRQVYQDKDEDNQVENISFYSPSSGFVAFTNWLGYTTDSGRTYTKKFITIGNVDFGLYSVNLTFGFGINGVKAFDKDKLVVYGDYGLVPAILYSSDGGNSFKLIYHSQYDPMQLRTGITDLVFLPDNKTGYAIDADRILKSNDGGISWSNVLISPGSYFDHIEAGNDQVIAMSTQYETNKLIRSTNGGQTWQSVQLPALNVGKMSYAYFLNSSTGWLSMTDYDHNGYFYKTNNGGTSWKLLNNINATNFSCGKMVFTDENTGYALGNLYTIYKTLNSGITWEPLPRDNDYTYLGFGNNDIQCLSGVQLWAGGGHGFLEMSNNGGGTPLPKAYFDIDTAGVASSGRVNLVNYSRSGYSCRWFLNDQQISTSFQSFYEHDINRTTDTITLVVSNGVTADTLKKFHYFYPPVTISSFSPAYAGKGYTVTITGTNFLETKNVTFGGVPALSFKVVSSTTITAVVGLGASGNVQVNTPTGQGVKGGFVFIPPPEITSFTPVSASFNTPITINGSNFTNVSSVRIGGVPAENFKIISPSRIVANAPSGPGGSIIVTTPGGTDSLSGYSSIATVNSFTPSQGTQGTLLQISGTSFDGVNAVTIGGVNVLSFTVNSSNSITAIVGAGNNGEVKITKPSGSSSAPGFSWYAPPVIAGFTPTSGPVGTAVTLTGSGFNPVANLNTVYFGAVKAVVSSATSSSLTVKVPAGATFEKINVTSHSLIGYSNYPFLVTFSNGGSIAPGSFNAALTISAQPDVPTNIVTADLDQDGKTDLIVTHYATDNAAKDGVLLYRNTSSASKVSFATPVNLPELGYSETRTGDFDGDGKIDLVVIKGSKMVVFRNSSTSGSLSFSTGTEFGETGDIRAMAVSDIDGDGKVDIVAGTKVYRNISEPGSVNFAPAVAAGPVSERNIVTADLNGDHKDDIIISGAGVLINQSTKGNISFKPLIPIPAYINSFIAAGDIDGDGKTDVVTGNFYGSTVSVVLNTTSGGNVSFGPPMEFSASFSPAGIALSDMDGDGKLDIVSALGDQAMGILKNTSTPGNMSFAPQVSYLPDNYGSSHMINLADIDNDGKNDVVSVSGTNQKIIVFLNTVKAIPFIQSFTPTLGNKGTTVTITGANFTGITSVRFGGIEATSFAVVSPTKITAVVGSGATGDITITNNLGVGSLSGFVYGAPLTISSLSPLKGEAGTTVTLSGTNFSSALENNIVSFGGVNAKVLTATPTKITVSVPFGSVYKPVSVTVGGATAWSGESFLTTFPGESTKFDNNSFAPRIDRLTAWNVETADINGDGRLDMVSIVRNGIGVGINTSTSGNISFAPLISFPVPGSVNLTGQADLDGDGKTDIAVIADKLKLYFLRNTSTLSNVSFGTLTEYTPGLGNSDIMGLDITDLDGDGKPDLVTTNYSTFIISIFKNASSPGNISFSTHFDLGLDHYGTQVYLRDLNGDGKPEIICAGGGSSFYVFRNTSTPGNISFAPKFAVGTSASTITISDIDGDGKADVVCLQKNSFSVFRNISTNGNISFAAEINFSTGTSPILNRIYSNDLDGDGKPELFTTNNDLKNISVFKNTSAPGTVSFNSNVNYDVTVNPRKASSCDLDGDGKADLVISGDGLTILRNTSGSSNGPGILGFTPQGGVNGAVVTISGNNFTGTTGVSFGGVAATSFKVISDHEISAVVGSGASGVVVVTTTSGSGSLPGFIYSDKPLISIVTPSAAIPGSTVTITGANFSSVKSVSFGGVPATSFVVNSSTSITAVTGQGSPGKIAVGTQDTIIEYDGFKMLLPPTIATFTPTTSGSGSEVSITGSNFYDVASVTFGGTPARSFNVVSPTLIRAIVGNGVSGDVRVITSAGKISLAGYRYLSSSWPTSFYPAIGSKGSSIIINGFNIGTVKSVFFGDAPAASFIIESPTRIVAIVGDGASGDVSITDSMGTHKLAGFTYVAETQPIITSFAPATGSMGSTITINGNNFNRTTKVSFNGVPAASFTVTSPFSIKAIVGTGGSGKVSITSPGGTDSLDGFIFTKAPVIASFSPQKAEEGSIVTITGANFSSASSGNIVFFGTVKAQVISASSTQLIVTVPQGATFQPISVTSNALTGYSNKFFLPLYGNSGPLQAASYASGIDSISGVAPHDVSLGDIDGDTKLDLTVVGGDQFGSRGNATFFRNTSEPSVLKLEPKKSVSLQYSPLSNCYADCNGDGLLDMVTMLPYDLNAVKIYQNNSTPANIIFNDGPLLTFGIGEFIGGTADFDGDGKPDIAAAGNYTGAVAVYKNTSTNGTISFAKRITFGVSRNPTDISIADMDLDGKPDILVSGNGTFTILRNTSSEGNISFANVTTDPANVDFDSKIKTGDFDGDGLPDIIMTKETGVVVIRNRSIPGYIQMDPSMFFSTGGNPNSVDIADMDGDGFMDIIVAHKDQNTLAILSNISTPGNLSFSPAIPYATSTATNSIRVADIDADGRPDILTANTLSNSISIFKQQITGPSNITVTLCAKTDTSFTSNVSGANYQWQQNTGTGFIDITDNSNITGANTAILALKDVPITWNKYSYKCIVDGVSTGTVFKLNINESVIPTISIVASDTTFCQGTQISLNTVVTNGGNAPIYNWKKNGISMGVNDPQYNGSDFANGDIITATLTSNAVCAAPANITSSPLQLSVNSIQIGIIISGKNVVISGKPATFTSSVINGGAEAKYQWQDSTATHTWEDIAGATKPIIDYIPAISGDKIRCRITSSEKCTNGAIAYSNVIELQVKSVEERETVRYYPNPVTSSLTIDSLKLNDKWQTLEIVSFDGLHVLSKEIKGKTSLTIHLDNLQPGMYVAILRRAGGDPVYLKFIKL
jgi:hypothetical protein